MRQAEHDRIIETAVTMAATHKIVVQDVSGVRCHKAVYAVPISTWTQSMNSLNRSPVGKPIWGGPGTMSEIRNLCRDLKERNLMDKNANETFQSSKAKTGYYDP
jgi:hypothetical protein